MIQIYGDDGSNPRVRIISVPCYDENGDSNFKYDYGKGFESTIQFWPKKCKNFYFSTWNLKKWKF